MKLSLRILLHALLVLSLAAPGAAATPDPAPAETSAEAPTPAAIDGARFVAGLPADPELATAAYLDRLDAAEQARGDEYHEGGLWLRLWHFGWRLGVALLLLASGLSAGIRRLARRVAGTPLVQSALYAVGYFLTVALLHLPFHTYARHYREHRYGLSNRSLGEWLLDYLLGLRIDLVVGTVGIVVLYVVLRRAPRTWWLWGAAVAIVLLVLVVAISPVVIMPMYHQVEPLSDPAVRQPILELAERYDVPVEGIFVYDESRRSPRITAHVTGLFGTEQILLSDNLLARCTLPEIEVVAAHEIGHRVLGHIVQILLFEALLLVGSFAFVRWSWHRITDRFGDRWGIEGIADPAGFPLLLALLTTFFFVVNPFLNTFIRTHEKAADRFALEATQLPEGLAEVTLKRSGYSKMSPSELEEWLFYKHPSGRSRIETAMRFRAERLAEEGAGAPSAPP